MKPPRHTLDRIWREFSGEAAWQTVADLSRFHRVQASPGYRQAAQWLVQRLSHQGIAAEILTYPANEQTRFWACQSFQEWDCTEATLHLIAPSEEEKELADFRACPLALVQRSAPFEGEAEVILLEDGEEEEEYAGLEVAGKVVLSCGDLRRVYELAVEQRGAIGILFDGMRTIEPVRPEGDLPDIRQYTSFWWQPGDRKCFGFVLTPRQGQALRRLLKKTTEPVRIHAKVVSRLYDGALEVVSAMIPGQTNQEVLVIAHLCHPMPSANDNASGAAAILEAARALHTLIAAGQLLPPTRAIRFLWVPEMTGTFAYLTSREAELDRMIAGINLDMVGEDQEQTGSAWLIERPPEAAASFAPDLLARLRDELPGLKGMPDVSSSYTGVAEYLLYRQAEVSFSGGSDHYVLSDPGVGIPTPMLIQWPDRFYHTSADTPDRTDPQSLARSGSLAAAYAYWLATAGTEEATWLGYEMIARFKSRLIQMAQAAVGELLSLSGAEEIAQSISRLDRRLSYLVDRQQAALRTLERLAPVGCLVTELQKEAKRVAEQELARVKDAADLYAASSKLEALPFPDLQVVAEKEQQAAALVPIRRVRGPIYLRDHIHRLEPSEREAWRSLLKARKRQIYDTLMPLALYWADGSRSVSEIAELVELETGIRDGELLLAYFRILQKLGLG
ncbi:MAG: DUF4910 domain-containing protein [Anaerolineae bacterium]